MLRIGFDAKRAFLNNTGLGNYSRSVITSLASSFPENEYFLYTTKQINNSRTAGMLDRPGVIIRTPAIPILKSLWRSRFVVNCLIKDEIDLYHGLSHEIPVAIQNTSIKTVVTIHDLIFLRYPQYYKPADRKIYEMKFRNACKNANKIIAISEQTKRDIIHYFGTDEAKIEVVYQSCDPSFAQKYTADHLTGIKEKYRLPEKFLLNVGTIEDRKNLMLIVKALSEVPEEIKLVVIGKETPYAGKVKKYLSEHQLENRVILLKDIPFHDLPAIYQLAKIFIYPSEFEGFGIPVLEALNAGVPVIAATGSCLEEAGGPSSLYVPPTDHKALAKAVNNILQDSRLGEDMIVAGKLYAEQFKENAHAENLMRIYKNLLAR
ncbi:MAG: glycosyltransferase family 1 protein [Taibaiella sp.]|jgi:glycosyltransferase involved in cell wall biosynthesis